MARAVLKVVDENFEVHDAATPEETIKALQSALARAERTIQGLKAKEALERKNYVRKGEVREIFDEWKTTLKEAGLITGRQQLGNGRFDAIRDLIEAGYTREQFTLMIEGIVAAPYEVYGKRRATGSKDSLEVDIARVCEKERYFEQSASLGALARRHRDA